MRPVRDRQPPQIREGQDDALKNLTISHGSLRSHDGRLDCAGDASACSARSQRSQESAVLPPGGSRRGPSCSRSNVQAVFPNHAVQLTISILEKNTIKKLTKATITGFVGVATILSGAASLAQAQQEIVKNIVLGHGAF